MKPAPGMMVTRHVRLVEPIGEGAMGSVWLAEHVTLHTKVAVKLISGDLAQDDPGVLVRFQQEASASAQIKSPYVVQVFDHGLAGDRTAYIVMELLEGESLADRLERTEVISLRQTGQVLVQVGKALDRAHQEGIIHRDIKPENIFLSTAEDGLICKVLDFGIAKQTKLADQKGVTLPGTTVGTPEYMSREQVMTAQEIDSSADRWALAVVAYHCLTGELPFDGATLGMVCVAICRGTYPSTSSLRPDLPPEVDGWFERALHTDQTERWGTCKEMALAFLQLVPKDEEDIDSLQSGEFSLPPPSAPDLRPIGPLPPLDSAALLNAAGGSPAAAEGLPPSSASDSGRRLDTPTFNGAAAELDGAKEAKRPWRRTAVGAIGAMVLVAAGVLGGVILRSGTSSDPESSAAGATPTASDSASSEEGQARDLSTPPSELGGAGAQPAPPDGGATADASAKPPRSPRSRYPYEPRPKPRQKDLGF